ncbi:MAG: OsmC family protein [Verrucomicrobiia bacterium]
MALKSFAVNGVSESLSRISVRARQFNIIVDEPPALGGEDKGANPVEYLLTALIGCLNIVAHLVAKEMGIKIERLEIDASGELNTDKLLGVKTVERPGFRNINVNIKARTDADEVTLEKWLVTVKERCPVSDNIANSTPVNITVQKA